MHALNAQSVTTTTREARALHVSAFLFWVFMMTAMVLLLDPFNPGFDGPTGNTRLPLDHGPVKYVGVFLGWGALALGVLGMVMNQPRVWTQARAAFARSWPITLCALFMLGGSLYARVVLGYKETFLQAPVGMTAYFIGLAYMFEVRDPLNVVRVYFSLLLAASAFMAWVIIDRWFHGGQAFHEEIFLLVPLAIYYFLINGRGWIGWMCVLGFACVAVLSYKNTSYLVLLQTLGYLGLLLTVEKVRRYGRDSLRKFITVYGVALLVIVSLLVLLFIFIDYQDRLPDGSVEVRSRVYATAWQRFLESPLYGTAFSGSIHVSFDLYPILGGNIVETHSDVLDALSHGGVIGFALFVFAYVTPFRLARVHERLTDVRLHAALHGLRAIALGGIMVMLFNPVIVGLPINTMFWLNAGLLAGLGMRYGYDHDTAVTGKRPRSGG